MSMVACKNINTVVVNFKRVKCMYYNDIIHKHTFVFFSPFDHDVSIQFLQLSMQVFQPAVRGPQLAVHLRKRRLNNLFRSKKTQQKKVPGVLWGAKWKNFELMSKNGINCGFFLASPIQPSQSL